LVLGLFLGGNVHAATLDLAPSETVVKKGEVIAVDIILDTEGANIDGVDLYSLNYDPEIFTAVSIIPGTLMPYTIYSDIEEDGNIKFSQITSVGTTFSGSGTFATVFFLAKTEGSSDLELDFVPGSTLDTNVAAEGGDVLSSVENTSVRVVSKDSLLTTIITSILQFII
jgi:hypothetical protein